MGGVSYYSNRVRVRDRGDQILTPFDAELDDAIPPLVHELEKSKMGKNAWFVYHLASSLIYLLAPDINPSSRRIGGKCGITPHIMHGKT